MTQWFFGPQNMWYIRVSAGSASGYEGSASFLSMKAWALCDGNAQVFFCLCPAPLHHTCFLSQAQNGSSVAGIFVKSVIFRSTRLGTAQTHLLILNTSVRSQNLHFLRQAERRLSAWRTRHRRAIISGRASLSDTNGSNASGFEYPASL